MRNIIKDFSVKCLSLSYLGEDWNNNLLQSIIEAGRTISYVETLNPSKADKFHLSIKGSDKKTFMREFEKIVRFAIVELGLKNKRIKIGFDTTEDLTWIKSCLGVRAAIYERGLMSWQYLNVSIVEPFFMPLMSIPYTIFDNLDNLVIDLLKYIKTLPFIVELILFDRGFYHAHLIDYLNGKNRGWSWPYLMLVPERKAQKKYIFQTIKEGKRFASYNHVFNYSKNKSKWHPCTTIMVRVVDKNTVWCYATNQKPSLKLCLEYPKRWNLETGFRVHDEARIKSKSKNSLIRFFYHLLGMLLIILWRLQNRIKTYVFKRYLKLIEYQFYPKKVRALLVPP